MQTGILFKKYSPGAAMDSLCQRILADISKLISGDPLLRLQVELLSSGEYTARIDVRSDTGSFLGRGQDAFDSVAVSQAAKHVMDSILLWSRAKRDEQFSST